MVAGGAPTRVDVALVTGDFFLGATPAHGRLLAPGDDDPGGSPAVAVVSHRAWTTHFGRDASIVGRAPGTAGVHGRRRCRQPAPGPDARPGFLGLVDSSPRHARPRPVPGAHGRAAGRVDVADVAALVALARDRLPAEPVDWRFVARPVNHVRLGPDYHRAAARFLTVRGPGDRGGALPLRTAHGVASIPRGFVRSPRLVRRRRAAPHGRYSEAEAPARLLSAAPRRAPQRRAPHGHRGARPRRSPGTPRSANPA